MSTKGQYKPHPVAWLLIVFVFAGLGVLAYRYFGSYTLYINGAPIQGTADYFSLFAGLVIAGVLGLFLVAGLSIIALGLLLLVGSVLLFAATPLLLPLVLVFLVIYLIFALARRR